MLFQAERLLVVAAHPDDEVLGCGGVIARHAESGADIRIVFLSDGVAARGEEEAALQRRQAAAREAARILGATIQAFLPFPDNRMDAIPLLDVVKPLESIVDEFQPTVVYTHSIADLNVDHSITNQAVRTACRPLPGTSVQAILTFEVPSSSEWAFRPDQEQGQQIGLDISAQLVRKLTALSAYAEEMRPFPHPRSTEAVEALARWRGATHGFAAAEAFSLTRLSL